MELEPGIVTDLRDRQRYGGYLCLDRLLDAQQPVSGTPGAAPRHDKMLFITKLIDVRTVIGAPRR